MFNAILCFGTWMPGDMKPVSFPQATVVYAKDQPEYVPLPAHVSIHGVVTSCWELSNEELAEIILTRRIWLQAMTFGAALQPAAVRRDPAGTRVTIFLFLAAVSAGILAARLVIVRRRRGPRAPPARSRSTQTSATRAPRRR
jgi:hypothetical protein